MIPDENRIIQDYISSATLHGKASLKGDYKTANKQYKILAKIYKEFQKNPSMAKFILERLFTSEVPSVRIWAASHALQLNIDIEHAESILIEYSTDKNIGILQLNSQMVLKEWRKKSMRL